MFTEERKPSSLRHLHRNTYSTPQWGWLGGGYPLRWFLQPQENISSETSNPCTCFHPGKQPGCSWDGETCSAAKNKASPCLRGSACVWTVVACIGTDLQVIKNQSNPLTTPRDGRLGHTRPPYQATSATNRIFLATEAKR